MMRLLIVNQYFPPDLAASSQLLGPLAGKLAERCEVQVICGTPTYAPDFSEQTKVSTHRIPLFSKGRANLLFRLLNYGLFLFGAFFRALLLPKHDVIMCWTDPPLTGLIGVILKWVKGSRFLFVSQDVYPEIAVAAKKMDHPVSRWLLHQTSRLILRHADRVIVLGEDMKQKLLEKGAAVKQTRVIQNWQDTDRLRPIDASTFRTKMGISKESFVVMHSGNIGFSQDLDTLLEVADLTRSNLNIQYIIVGDGAESDPLKARAQAMALQNVRFLPYQPKHLLAESLSAADIHYVSLKQNFLGLIVPSKIYGILAVGKPVIANVPTGCQIETILKIAQCGIIANQGPKKIAEAILSLKHNSSYLLEMGKNGRNWIEKNASQTISFQKYIDVLSELEKR